MKINQVAELVDITKKNIRFYEDQGLVDPGRDPQNGYREYSLDDVRQLMRIKLLRQLGISCDNIRKMKDGKLEIEKCMHDRLRELEEEERSIDHMRTMCDLLSQETGTFSSLDASLYLDKMKELEKGGGKFMNIRMSDVRKRKTGAIIAAAFMVVLMAAMIVLIFWADKIDPAPKGVLIVVIALFGSIIVGVLIALVQRLKEVKKGELDEANKY
ncbi:MAG: MerR family transcriptional regulator [Firmicutes bacterium]|nr:MerR family transcriptional regulator [Bacillota bacterium]